MDRVAIDTNVLVYAEGVERAPQDAEKVARSRRLMRGLLHANMRAIIPVQVLAELHRVLVGRKRLLPAQAAATVRNWAARSDAPASNSTGLEAALTRASDHGLQIFDALILAAAVEARCDLLLSEDFHDGFAWRGVVVTDPFGATPDPRLAHLTAPAP